MQSICLSRYLHLALAHGPIFYLRAPFLKFYLPVLRFAAKICYNKPRFQYAFLLFSQNCSGDEVVFVIVTVSTYTDPASNYMYLLFKYNHSYKKWKDSLETQAISIEISLVSWNLPNNQKHRRSVLRNMVSFKGNQLLAETFHAIMDKIEADILQTANKWNWKWIFIHQG